MRDIDRLLEIKASEYKIVDVIALRDAFLTLRAELDALRKQEPVEADEIYGMLAELKLLPPAFRSTSRTSCHLWCAG